MKRGLYVRPGEVETARHAAWAYWLLVPTTNDSKVFRGFIPLVDAEPPISSRSKARVIGASSISSTSASAAIGLASCLVEAAGPPPSVTNCTLYSHPWARSMEDRS